MIHQNIDTPEYEEMLSRYIDDRASERERTEVKRLAANDEAFAKRLTQMKNQKALLNNLPVSSAPAWLTEEIKLSLERKLLLNKQPDFTDEAAGHRNLLFKRFAAAAIILVLFGSLVYIVMQAFTPASDLYKDQTLARKFDKPDPVEKTLAKTHVDTVVKEAYKDQTPVFTASLDILSADPAGMNNYITKVAYIYDIEDNIFKDAQGDKTSYHVTANVDQVRSLVSELAAVWEECKNTKLTTYSISGQNDIVIDNISAAQISAIFKQDNLSDRISVARDFSDFNAVFGTHQKSDQYANRLADRAISMPTPERPELTSGQKQPTNDTKQTNEEKINLTITIQSAPK